MELCENVYPAMAVLTLLHLPEATDVYISWSGRESTPLYLCRVSRTDFISVLVELAVHFQLLDWSQQVAEDAFELKVVKESFGSDTRLLINEIHDRIVQLQKKGMSLRTLREALLQYQTPSRISVTPDYRILLVDYGNLEIRLTPLCKVLYLLFLQHPEGIAFKELADHRDELLSLYCMVAPTLNPSRREAHICRLISPLDNSLNEKISQIRRALCSLLDDNVLPYYVVTGEKGMKKKIHINPDLIGFVKKQKTTILV